MSSLLSLLQFTTILPLGKPQDIKEFARHSWLYPLAGYVIGCLAAVPVLFIADRTVAAAVAVALVLLISGAHHFDGLLDLGDGLMAHGDREKRVRALTDRQVGAGGVATGIVTTLLLFAGLSASATIAAAIIAGEVCAKFSMAYLTAFGEPFREGIHSYLHQEARPDFAVLAGILCLPLFLLPLAPVKIAGALVVMVLCPAVLLLLARRLFGGVNGDVAGASNEITRAMVVITLVLL
ncbi:MAG: adenosylcobinamide-GDP ribazoletransferase [Methanoregula sp.]